MYFRNKSLLLVYFITSIFVYNMPAALSSDAQKHFSAEKLGRSSYCGLCHTAIYQQWNASSHHFSSFNNPVYRKVIMSEVGTKNQTQLRFCARCHDPLLLVSGEIGNEEELNVGSWQANAGITCLTCHRLTDIGKNNGEYVIKEPLLHPFAFAEQPLLQKAHSVALNLTPWLHRMVVSQPIYKESEFCAVCHTLKVPKSINGHTDITLLKEYDSWKSSPYNPTQNKDSTKRKKCQNCHMKLIAADDPAAINGMVHDHGFAAGNTVLAMFNSDYEHLEKAQTFLSEDTIRLELLRIGSNKSKKQKNYSVKGITNNQVISLNIAVHNDGVGHHFPAGTVDSNEAWISFVIIDKNGDIVVRQGQIDVDGHVPDNAVRFGSNYVDEKGAVTNRATTTTHAIALRDSLLIAPGEYEEIKFVFPLPPDFQPPLRAKMKLNWRKYDPMFLKWVYDGRKIPQAPITVIDEIEFALPVSSLQLQYLSTMTIREE